MMDIDAVYRFDLGFLGSHCPNLTHLSINRFLEVGTPVLPSVRFLQIEQLDWYGLKSVSIAFPDLLFLCVTEGSSSHFGHDPKSITFDKLQYLDVKGHLFGAADLSRLHIKEVRGLSAEAREDGIALASALGSQFQVLEVRGCMWGKKRNFIASDLLLRRCPNISTLVTVLGYVHDPPEYEESDAVYSRIETLIFSGKDRLYIEPWKNTYWNKRRFPNVQKMIVEMFPDEFHEPFCTWAWSGFDGVTVERRGAYQVCPVLYRDHIGQ
jgi:hypothetical protein